MKEGMVTRSPGRFYFIAYLSSWLAFHLYLSGLSLLTGIRL